MSLAYQIEAMTIIHKSLNTERFDLEPLSQEDALKLADLGSDPDVVKSLICDWSTAEHRLEIAQYWIEGGQEYGIWGIYDRDNTFDAPERFVGFFAADEPLPNVGQGPEIYYALGKQVWGKGVATEVVKTVVAHLFNDQGVDAIEALVLAGLNPASSRLLEKLGMSLIGRYSLAEYTGDECLPTIGYELWRVETTLPQNAQHALEEAAFKIGQFVAEKVISKNEMLEALVKASFANGLESRVGKGTVERIINEYLEAGMKETGLLHFRMRPDQFIKA
jgi:RimJ/RimL family protein N-acetyltransferase